MGGWAKFFELLASEDVDSDKMDLGVTVLASLGGRHVDDLARTVLDHNEAVLPQGRTLHGEGGRGAGIGGLEGMLMLYELSVGNVLKDVEGSKIDNSSMRPTGGGACAGFGWLDKYLPGHHPPSCLSS